MKSGLLLDIVVLKCAAILELLTGEDQALLVRGDTLLVLDLGLDSLDGVSAIHLKGDGLAGESLDEDLHAYTPMRNARNVIKAWIRIASTTYLARRDS